MSTKEYETTGYALSSWNYGSFHPCNPCYNKRESIPIKDNLDQKKVRSESASHNKKILNNDEKIVTEGYLQVMKDLKTMKNINNQNKKSSENLKRTKSSFKKSESTSQINHGNIDNYNTSMINNSNMNITQDNIKAKNYKYQLNFEEWEAVKAKQTEIYNKVKIIKESEDQNFEFFNKKIDENYKVIQEQNFNEWLQKKQIEKAKFKEIKSLQEYYKQMEKQKKQSDSYSKMENWIKRQAAVMDMEIKLKKMKEDKLKSDQLKKQRDSEIKRVRANEAFNLWMLRKEEEKKYDKPQIQNIKSNNSLFKSKSNSKILIGPYSDAKKLKEIQKKVTAFESEYGELNNSNSEKEEKGIDKENIEDSLQELSSIKKDSPLQEQDHDYY